MLVDTDVCIDFFSGTEPGASAVTELIQKNSACVSVITLFELSAGITGEKRKKQIDVFSSVVPAAPVADAEALKAAEIYTDLRKSGKLIGNQDILIASTALVLDMPLVTRNTGHFGRVPGLNVMSPEQVLEMY